MDQFGISTAMRCMAEVYFVTARRTGRTTQMLDSLKDGDRVVCLSENEARRLELLCRERGLKVAVRSSEPQNYEGLYQHHRSEGRTVFDHSWVEEYFRLTLEEAERNIDRLQTLLSGQGMAHLVNRQETLKWHGYEPKDSKDPR